MHAMSPWLAVAVASVLVLRLAGVALPNELRRFSEFQYCDLEDRLNAAWLHSFRICLPLEAQLSFLSACAQVLCQFPDSTVQFTWATVLEDTRQGGLPWTWLIHFGPSLARAAMVCVTSGAHRLQLRHAALAWTPFWRACAGG